MAVVCGGFWEDDEDAVGTVLVCAAEGGVEASGVAQSVVGEGFKNVGGWDGDGDVGDDDGAGAVAEGGGEAGGGDEAGGG
jgi:hypothetical protein